MIGAHVSAQGGVHATVNNARDEQLECFQFFSRPPQGGKAPELTPSNVKQFQDGVKKNKFHTYIHAPYFVNLASINPRVYHGSMSVLKQELERGNVLGVNAMMTHLGTANGQKRSVAMTRMKKALKEILADYDGATWFLLEISAGSGEVIGDTFEEIAELVTAVDHPRLGVCFDTCHAFASGYDLRTPKDVNSAVKKFDAIVGLSLLKVIHMNDSKGALGGRLDRHAHIGQGNIGERGMAAILNHPKLRKLDFILETPREGRVNDVKILKKLRKPYGTIS